MAALRPGGKNFGRAKRPVNSITHLNRLERRFDMYVGSARLDRVTDDLINAAHDRRLIGDIAQALQIELARIMDPVVAVDKRQIRSGAVKRGPSLVELRGRRHAQLHFVAGRIGERLHRLQVERIGHREPEATPRDRERQQAIRLNELLGDLTA